MADRERQRAENLEAENSPEQAVNSAVTTIENRDAADPVISSGRLQKAKEFLKNNAEEFFSRKNNWEDAKLYTRVAASGIGIGIIKMVWGILKFAKKAIEKKGNITFREGYEIGKDALSFEDRKDKK